MKDFKITVSGKSGSISYDIYKTLRGAKGVAKRLANEAFYGEEVIVSIVAL